MNISQILTKLKSLVYSKSEADTLLSSKASSSHKHTKSEITDFPTIPSKTSQLTNDSGFLTSHQSLANYSTLANTVKSLAISGKTITVTPGSGNAYTLTTQDTVYTHPTTAGNKHVPSGGSSGQFLGWDSAGTAKWVNNPNSDTKNTAGSTDTSSKIFLVGATSQAANPQTYSHDTAYVGTDGCLYSGGTKVLTAHQSLSNYSTLANTIKSLSISGKTITYTKGDNTTGTLTTQDTNTTYSNFVKSGSGAKAGLVPAPSTTAGTTKYLREDGTWQVPPDHTYKVYNKTLTIQKNGTNVATFTSNSNTDVTANITVPTKVSQLTNDSGFITTNGAAYPRRVGGVTMNFNWSGQGGQPTWLWGGEDGTNMYVYNPANFSVNYANSAGGVAWTNVSGRPTALSQFTNDSGFLTSTDRLPIGSYIQFAGSQAPAGFLVCNGGAISRTTYSQLFAVIGTTYGSGDGSTTFNLPNLTDRFLQGSTTSGTVKNAGLPEIYGGFGGRFVNTPDGANVITLRFGAFRQGGVTGAYRGLSSPEPVTDDTATDFFASGSNSIYGSSSTVQPPALTCLICIKY